MNALKVFTLITLILFDWSLSQAQVYDIVVSPTGKYAGTAKVVKTISAAMNNVVANKTTRTLILIKNGTYKEKVTLASGKNNVSLIGESVDGVVITYDDYNAKVAGMSTAGTYSFLTEGNDFYAENITFKNTSGNVGQAVAVHTTGDRQIFNRCKFYGFQDTYYAQKGRQYNVNCYVEGATDFIFGNSTAVYDSCTINCVSGGQFVSAPGDAQLLSFTATGDTIFHGLMFNYCKITANSDVSAGSYYLGRTWAVPGASIFKNCTLGDHIRAEGWWNWTGTKGRYAEYKSIDNNGDAVDVSSRVSWSRQLSDEYASNYYNLDSFLCKSKVVWSPVASVFPLVAPSGLAQQGDSMVWNVVANAKGYTILRNDSVIAFSTSNSFRDTLVEKTVSSTYKIKSVSSNGNLSDASNVITAYAAGKDVHTVIEGVVSSEILIVANKILKVSEEAEIQIFDITGKLILKTNISSEISLKNLISGTYIVKARTKSGQIITKKIVL